MAATGLRFENRLEGALNFVPWKARVTLILVENGLWNFANTTVTPLTGPQELVIHEQKDVKSRRIILDTVKNHLIPHLSEKKSTREMFEALTNRFQSSITNKKMVLREIFIKTKITRLDRVTNCLTKITQVRDQLRAVGEVVTDEEMVKLTLNGFTKTHAPFIKGIIAEETLPKFDML
jgi:hypothetical protein